MDKKEGLKLAIEIIEKERLIAIKINPVMALGMNHVKVLIEQELEKESENGYFKK